MDGWTHTDKLSRCKLRAHQMTKDKVYLLISPEMRRPHFHTSNVIFFVLLSFQLLLFCYSSSPNSSSDFRVKAQSIELWIMCKAPSQQRCINSLYKHISHFHFKKNKKKIGLVLTFQRMSSGWLSMKHFKATTFAQVFHYCVFK